MDAYWATVDRGKLIQDSREAGIILEDLHYLQYRQFEIMSKHIKEQREYIRYLENRIDDLEDQLFKMQDNLNSLADEFWKRANENGWNDK